jgi:hypothetical protein
VTLQEWTLTVFCLALVLLPVALFLEVQEAVAEAGGARAWCTRNRVLLEVVLLLVGSVALFAWRPDWSVTWALLWFVLPFGVQRVLVFMGNPMLVVELPFLAVIPGLLLGAMIFVDEFASPHLAHPHHRGLWSAAGFVAGVWLGWQRGEATG